MAKANLGSTATVRDSGVLRPSIVKSLISSYEGEDLESYSMRVLQVRSIPTIGDGLICLYHSGPEKSQFRPRHWFR